MKSLHEQIQALYKTVLEDKKSNKNVIDLPYIYITRNNNSLNPICRKVGCSGKDDDKGSEDIIKKLQRYSTPVPDNWECYVVIWLTCNGSEAVDYELDFIEELGKENRYNNKELFKNLSDTDVIAAIANFMANDGNDNNYDNIHSFTIDGKHVTKEQFKKDYLYESGMRIQYQFTKAARRGLVRNARSPL